MKVSFAVRGIPAVPAIFALALVLVLLAAAVPPASGETFDHGWKATGTGECGAQGDKIRCLLSGTEYPTGAITVTNLKQSKVSFSWDEWHSACGAAGGKVVSKSTEIAGGDTKVLFLLSPGAGITCREEFIYGCRLDGAETKCPDVLKAIGRFYAGNKQ